MAKDTVTYERALQLQAIASSGADKPAGLTPAESESWDHSVAFLKRAEANGWTVAMPGENAGAFK